MGETSNPNLLMFFQACTSLHARDSGGSTHRRLALARPTIHPMDPVLLSDKMNCTVRFGEMFPVGSPDISWQQGWYIGGTIRKQFTKPTVHFILSLCRGIAF